jgi:hypothetical protein
MQVVPEPPPLMCDRVEQCHLQFFALRDGADRPEGHRLSDVVGDMEVMQSSHRQTTLSRVPPTIPMNEENASREDIHHQAWASSLQTWVYPVDLFLGATPEQLQSHPAHRKNYVQPEWAIRHLSACCRAAKVLGSGGSAPMQFELSSSSCLID